MKGSRFESPHLQREVQTRRVGHPAQKSFDGIGAM